MNKRLCIFFVLVIAISIIPEIKALNKPRVVVMSDAEIDDRCSFVRFLLYGNDFDIEGIITTSSQYHAHDHNWAGDDWNLSYLDAYETIYPNLIQHDSTYPTPEYLRSHSFLGNVDTEGEMEKITPGSQHIVNLLLDKSDDRPIWFQAWGGMNTLARALKTIEEDYPDQMDYVASKLRFYFIWEQDETYQLYIKPNWGKYNILTIIADQFITFGYWWEDWDLPDEMAHYFSSSWMNENLLKNHGPLLAIYEAQSDGRFRSEGDSPSFIHEIPTGLRSLDSPDWGGWGGRFTLVRDNTWLDPVHVEGYTYPSGRWYTSTAWGRKNLRENSATQEEFLEYFKPIWRWIDVMQNDFAARADWCVKSYAEANHPPIVKLENDLNISAKPGLQIQLSAKESYDPDGDILNYNWWQYKEADTYKGNLNISDSLKEEATLMVPEDAESGETIHIICEVKDEGSPSLVRYNRIVVTIDSVNTDVNEEPNGVGNFPTEFALNQNYPNPFNPTTIIKYEIPESSFVTLRIFNLLGKEVATLVNDYKNAGIYKVKFNGNELASGIYVVQMEAESFFQSIKIILLK